MFQWGFHAQLVTSIVHARGHVHSTSVPALRLLLYKVNVLSMQIHVQTYDAQCVLCHAMCSALSTRVASSHDSSHSGELSTCRHQKLPTLFRSGTCTCCTTTLSLVFTINTSVQNIANYISDMGFVLQEQAQNWNFTKVKLCISICVVLQNVRFRPQHVYCYFELLRRFLRTALL